MDTESRWRDGVLSALRTEPEFMPRRSAKQTNVQDRGSKWQLSLLHFYKICYFLLYLFLLLFGLLILRKTQNCLKSVDYVKAHSHTVSEEAVAKSAQFSKLLTALNTEFSKPPAIFLLNQYALNMTFNFLCSTRDLQGVHQRTIFLTLDSVAHDVLLEYWPHVKQIYWPVPSLYVSLFFSKSNLI